MAELEGCFQIFELPFMAADAHGKHGTGGCFAIVLVAGLIGLGVKGCEPEKPFKPKTTLQEKVIGHPINKWKIERAEKKWKAEQEKEAAEQERAEETVAPIKSETRLNRAKDWLRKKLNKDYENRHKGEDK
jgi:hypothetical protein